MRGAHAALSPNFGAPATPVPWQTVHVVSNVLLPSALPAAGAPPAAGAAAAGAPPATGCPACWAAATCCAGAAPCAGASCGTAVGVAAGGGIFAFCCFTQAAYLSASTASTTIGMYACSLPQIWLHW